MDDTREGLVCVRYRSWLYPRQFGPRKCMKNRVKSWILLVWDAPQTVLAKNQHGSMILYIVSGSKLRNIGLSVEKIILKEFAGQIFDQIFHIAIKIETPIYIYIYIYIYIPYTACL